MPVLEVGRLHARYDRAASRRAAALDDALRRVAEDGLAQELISHPIDVAYAVCVRRLALRVRLDGSRPVTALSRRWAAAIVAALEDELAGGADGLDVVVYRREVDALADVVASAATGDRARAWAWHQLGLVPEAVDRPTAADVARLLARRPHLAPATVVAVPDLAAQALDPRGWLRLAGAVRVAVGGPAVRPAPGSPPAPPESAVRGRAAVVDAARSAVPEGAWAAAGPEDRGALAVLALACVAPAHCRDPRTVGLVASAGDAPAGAGRHVASSPRPEAPAGRAAGPPGQAPGPAPQAPGHAPATGPRPPADPPLDPAGPVAPGTDGGPATGRARAPLPEAGPDAQPAAPDAVTSRYGGALFLVHAVTALDLAAEPAVLARVLAAATSVEPADPAVLAAAGWRGDDPSVLAEPLAPADEQRVAEHARRLRGWVARRLDRDQAGGPAAGPDADLDWVWARRAVIDARPGWVEATFALDDVDLRLRIAGLDLDPGAVWWLGGVVRFRYA